MAYTRKIKEADAHAIRGFLAKVKSSLSELKAFEVDLTKEGSPGNTVISHTVRNKLPFEFLTEIKTRSGKDYPTVGDIMEHQPEALRTMKAKFPRPYKGPNNRVRTSEGRAPNPPRASFNTTQNRAQGAGNSYGRSHENLRSGVPEQRSGVPEQRREFKGYPCKLCDDNSHTMSRCTKYSDTQSKIDQCRALQLCERCSSLKHRSEACPALGRNSGQACFNCKGYDHIGILCPVEARKRKRRDEGTGPSSQENKRTNRGSNRNAPTIGLCINTEASGEDNLLPTISLNTKVGNKTITTRWLLDMGSQASYGRSSLLQKFKVDKNSLKSSQNKIKTFLGEDTRAVYELPIEMKLCCDYFTPINTYIDEGLDINFKVKGIKVAASNVKKQGYYLADSHLLRNQQDETIEVDGLLGTDAIKHIWHMKRVRCMNGSALETCLGTILYGPVSDFLTPEQKRAVRQGGHQAHTRNTPQI